MESPFRRQLSNNMKKKKTPLLFIIPAVALFIAIGVATAVKLLSPENAMPAKAAPAEYPNPYGKMDGKKPSSFLGKLLGTNPTPTSAPSSAAADLSRELKDTVDDGGASDLETLQEDASGL